MLKCWEEYLVQRYSINAIWMWEQIMSFEILSIWGLLNSLFISLSSSMGSTIFRIKKNLSKTRKIHHDLTSTTCPTHWPHRPSVQLLRKLDNFLVSELSHTLLSACNGPHPRGWCLLILQETYLPQRDVWPSASKKFSTIILAFHISSGNSLVVQWLGLSTFTAGALVQSLVGKLRSPLGEGPPQKGGLSFTFRKVNHNL